VAVPPARAAVARVWRFGADRIHVGDAPSHPSGAALPNLGTRVTVEGAAQRFPVVVPGGRFSRPDSAWFDARGGGQVSLVYGEGGPVRLLVQEYPGDGRIMVDKYIKYEAQAEAVQGDGFRGLFIHGPPHTVVYERTDGREVTELGRLAGNALVIQRGELTIRIEGDFSRDEMVAIAASLR